MVSIDRTSGVVRCSPPKTADRRFQATSHVCDWGDSPPEDEAVAIVVHGDPWLHVQHEVRKSFYLIQLRLHGPSVDHARAFATRSAIGGRTLFTSARDVLLLASFRERGRRVLAVNPGTRFKTATVPVVP
jgi:hypothetical protein